MAGQKLDSGFPLSFSFLLFFFNVIGIHIRVSEQDIFQCLFRFLEDLLRAHDRLENTQQVLLAIRYLDSILVDSAYVERYIPYTMRCGVSLYIQRKSTNEGVQ